MLETVSMNDNHIFIVQEIFCAMYYQIEISPMVQSTVKFRQNMCICYKLICKTKFHMTSLNFATKFSHWN